MKSVGYSRSESSLFNVKPAASPVKTGARIGMLVAALMLAGGCWKDDPKATVLRILAENNPELSNDDILFEGCELRVSATNPNPLGGYNKLVLRADLALFNLDRGRIRTVDPDQVFLIFDRKPFNDRLVEQAVRISELLPADFQSKESKLVMSDGRTVAQENRTAVEPGEGIERALIERILKAPKGNLVFRLTNFVIGDEAMKPHKDAPVFFDFANRVRALPAPQAVVISLHFSETVERRENLLSGLVTIPKFLQFKARSLEQAKELGQALNDYRAEACDPD